jgi:phosphoglycolate phosphatase-like HAD superfamily hydrolase
MAAPGILALDFDGVLCEGTREYFEVSRRTYGLAWPGRRSVPDDLLAPFSELRPVIESGWEMPVLLKALVLGVEGKAIAETWVAARDRVLADDPRGRDEQVSLLRKTLDAERQRWIDADRADWLSRHALYGDAEKVRRMLEEPRHVAIVTTKEGEFARALVQHWGLPITDVQGKETGPHKCDNLRALRAAHPGSPPGLWFVEDRLETLQCVRTHRDLDDVRLFLATWGYNTPRTRDLARTSPGIDLLSLAEFTGGFPLWGTG